MEAKRDRLVAGWIVCDLVPRAKVSGLGGIKRKKKETKCVLELSRLMSLNEVIGTGLNTAVPVAARVLLDRVIVDVSARQNCT